MKMNFKSLMVLALAGATIATTSCSKDGCTNPEAVNYDADAKDDDGSCILETANNNITTNTTWSNDTVHYINGRVFVTNGATLTIEPGTIIKASAGTGANASALIVARGAKIMAEGTASQPIIFTSAADEISTGEIVSPNLSANQTGLWGGVIILGNAKGSFKGDVSEVAIEGIPATEVNGKYGGSNDADNSGVLSYVSIRHGGANIGEGNEINGLTLGGVGSGTTISNIEIVGNQDDGIEFFGGTVNVTNALVWGAGDDAIDTDQAWAGTINNFVVINPGDEAFELDGPEGSYESTGHTITNGTVFAFGASGLIDLDDNSDVNMSNVYFTNLAAGQDVEGFGPYVDGDDTFVGFTANTKGYALTSLEATIPAGSAKSDFFKDGSDASVTEVTTATVGADVSVFGWTLASAESAF